MENLCSWKNKKILSSLSENQCESLGGVIFTGKGTTVTGVLASVIYFLTDMVELMALVQILSKLRVLMVMASTLSYIY